MKSFRRILSLVLVLSMLLACAVSAIGCDKQGGGSTTGGETTATPGGTGALPGETTGAPQETDPAPEGKIDYNITVTSLGGLPLADVSLLIYAGDDIVGYGATDESGKVAVELEAGGSYSVSVVDAPEGYHYEDRYPVLGAEVEIRLESSVITENTSLNGVSYKLGDIMRDFTVTDSDGKTQKLSEILKEKDMVLLNFWYTTCTYCVAEFPYMNEAYGQYRDQVEILALNHYPSDTELKVKDFKSTYQLDFPMAKEDLGMQTAFDIEGYPTTVVVDRYGMICLIEAGGLPSVEPFQKIFQAFTASNYTQKVYHSLEELIPPEKPTVEMPSSDALSSALGTSSLGVTYRPETDGESAEYAWPFVIDTKDGATCIRPSNKNVTGSYAILYADVTLKKGDVLALDYLASSEQNADILYVLVDRKDIYQISGKSSGWATCYPFVALEDGVYELALCYMKDETVHEGDDVVYLKNLRVETVADIDVPSFIPRNAASNPREDGFGYNTYAEIVLNETDGYYHVGSKNGPLLLANLMGTSLFSDTSVWLSVYYGVQSGDFTEEFVSKIESYAMYANNSKLYGYCPVTTELREYLETVAKALGIEQTENEWLQICSYYDAYGTGGAQLEDPTKGLSYHSAFLAEMGKDNVVTYDRILVPRGLFYKFVPQKSGVYRIETHIDSTDIGDSLVGWIFLENGTEPFYEYKNEERAYNDPVNVSMVMYMEADKAYYIDIAYWDTSRISGTFTFDIKYEGEKLDHFVMAAPGPATYYESGDGVIDTEHAVTGGIKVKLGDDGYYHHLKEDGTLGSIVYADFVGFTEIFERTSLKDMIEKTDSFNFSISDEDQWVMDFLEIFKKDGVSYTEGFKIEWGDEYDYYMEYYQVEDVVKGIYHGAGKDYTEAAKKYIGKIIGASKDAPELQGCVAVTAELAEILQMLLDKFWFKGVEDGWIEFCYYYNYLG